MVVVFSIVGLIYVIPVAFGLTISALVGQTIGSGEIAKARKTMWLSLLTCLVTMTVFVGLIQFLGKAYIRGLVENEAIVEKAFSNLKVYCVVFYIDGLQQCMLSIIKALGM